MNDQASPPRSRSDVLKHGAILGGRFRLLDQLGRGGFGDVWRASELLPDGSEVREIALKILEEQRAEVDWASEAKVLASLRHRALVTIYSAGLLEEPIRLPFVAMELLEGKTLGAIVSERSKVPWRRSVHWMREIAGALDAIHLQGIVHLDLKPANLLLGTDGVPRVLDFGIARYLRVSAYEITMPEGVAQPHDELATGALLDVLDAPDSRPGQSSSRPSIRPSVIGTPGFMAPEILEGREAAPSADAYALGVCLFQLLTGQLPQRVGTVLGKQPTEHQVSAWRAEVRSATLAGELFRLEELQPSIPKGVVALVHRLLALDPRERPGMGELAAAFDEVWRRPYGIPDMPYAGLRAYGQEAEGMLFGRDQDAERLAHELETRSVLVLQGASGSGKSSLAVAGIVPALARRFVDGKDDWISIVVRPGQDIDEPVRRIRQEQHKQTGVVLVVDQLEELVTQLSPEARSRFVVSLVRYIGTRHRELDDPAPTPGLRVLVTLREDFTTRVLSLETLGPVLREGIRFVPPPSAGSVREIVLGSAEVAGVAVDDEKPVVDEVLKELRVGEGRLPLVSFALAEWWNTRQNNILSSRDWNRIGGVAGALSKHADATLASLPVPAQVAARDICLRLVSADGTRARVSESDLRACGAEHQQALQAFLDARLFNVDETGSVAIAHEALLNAWAALAGWISDEQADRKESAELLSAAHVWRAEQGAHRSELLLGDVRLARALELSRRRPDLVVGIQDLIRASRSKVWTRKLLVNGFFLLLLLLGAAAVTFNALNNKKHSAELASRENNLKVLQHELEIKQKEQAGISHELDKSKQKITKLTSQMSDVKKTLRQTHQQHRHELAKRFPKDSFEQQVVIFVQNWEHAWNLHDAHLIASFLAEEVDWYGKTSTPGDVMNLAEWSWGKQPYDRILISEINVVRLKVGETIVRMTQEHRVGGKFSLSVIRFELRGNGSRSFLIVKANTEKMISPPTEMGCPR
jgi:serine/threonine protein kinase